MSHNGETLDDKTVRELLAGKHKLVEVEPDAPVHLAAKRMCEHGVGALLVSSGEEIAGIFTERDILIKVVCELRDPAETRVEQAMTSEVITVDIDEPVSSCRRLMSRHQIRHLPVLKSGRPFAMLSIRDVLRAEVEAHRSKAKDLEHYVYDYR